jgi:alkylated DNA repair dioxygenase AlkB
MDAHPPGFVYRPEFVSAEEEAALVPPVRALTYGEVRMRGVVARRRAAHFGWSYAYESWRIEPGPPIPAFLLPLRERAAGLVGVDAEAFAEALVTEYAPGAGIGWHRDAPMFGVVVGVSLLGACRFRFRREASGGAARLAVKLAPRSAYVLDGQARAAWQHSIPPTRALRYSVTFRTLRQSAGRDSGRRHDVGVRS